MSISEPMFYIKVKNSGKKFHDFIFGEHSFYGRTLKVQAIPHSAVKRNSVKLL